MFAYCGNNPVNYVDSSGTRALSWQDRFAMGFSVVLVGIAILLSAPTGGSSLTFGALTISSANTVAAGYAAAYTGTAIAGDAIVAGILQTTGKPTSQNQMQKQVESGKAPKEVDRVDPPHVNAPNQQNHVHFKNGTAINIDGTQSHESRGVLNLTSKVVQWLHKNNWCMTYN